MLYYAGFLLGLKPHSVNYKVTSDVHSDLKVPLFGIIISSIYNEFFTINFRSTNMDPLLPKLRIYNASIPPDRHQCNLRCTKAAIVYQKENPAGSSKTPKPADVRLWKEETALEEAKGRVMATGVPSPTEQQYLGQLLVIFGKYCHCSFKWLLENDVGYVK